MQDIDNKLVIYIHDLEKLHLQTLFHCHMQDFHGVTSCVVILDYIKISSYQGSLNTSSSYVAISRVLICGYIYVKATRRPRSCQHMHTKDPWAS